MRFGGPALPTAETNDSAGASNVIGSDGHKPAIVSRNNARSEMFRAIGPCTDSGDHRLFTVPRVVLPGVQRIPTTEQYVPGRRNDPPWSVPCASQTSPVATDTAPPPVEPPHVSARFHGLRVRPNTSLNVDPPAPNSGVFDFAMTMPPSRSIRSTNGCDRTGT